MLQGTDTLLGPDPPESDYLEAYRQLRSAILALRLRSTVRSLLITSATQGEGKTTVAMNLATAMALASKATVCVDLDLHRPHLHELVDAPIAPGITDVLTGETSLADAKRPTGLQFLTIVPAGSHWAERSDILAAHSPRSAVDALVEQFEFVIMDSTPVLDFAVALELARVVDQVIVVARARRSVAPVVQAVDRLEEVGGTVAGIVVNDVLPEDRSGAGYPYTYYEEL
ncbi:MAG: CpsD/CapB family tyrosine-protein kinase [Armatimonadota bacterium]